MMTNNKPISLELKLYSAFVDGMMTTHQTDFPFLELEKDDQRLVNWMHQEGKIYVERMRRLNND